MTQFQIRFLAGKTGDFTGPERFAGNLQEVFRLTDYTGNLKPVTVQVFSAYNQLGGAARACNMEGFTPGKGKPGKTMMFHFPAFRATHGEHSVCINTHSLKPS
jgi:hypothetical protein